MLILSRWKRKTLEDATFGRLAYESTGFWEGKLTLAGTAIEITMAEERRAELAEWRISEADLGAYSRGTHVRVLTPGGSAGEPLHMLSSLERRSSRWDSDPEAARDACRAAYFTDARRPQSWSEFTAAAKLRTRTYRTSSDSAVSLARSTQLTRLLAWRYSWA